LSPRILKKPNTPTNSPNAPYLVQQEQTMFDRLTQGLDYHATGLTLRSQRQQVIASNIANADTPGFKARDFRFTEAMRAAVGAQPAGSAAGGQVLATNARHMNAQGQTGAPGSPQLLYRTVEQPSADNNSVDMNRERANFMDNAMRYEATLRFINGNVRTMNLAIQGQ
jgi:flagellar basal-body rod protein FlgB